ncbi:MAG TPA: hypothetical protein VGS12_07935 [Caulobacteraceae bacterium]|nr:hypothetical protein [Caulobacteraceae bacterium]
MAYGEGIDDERFRQRLAEGHGLFVIGNVGDWKGRSFRVGLMSPPQLEPPAVERTLLAIEETAARLQRA